jgi:hypothetical protein
MSIAQELALQIFPHFAESVLAGRRQTYGYYASLVGRDSAKHGLAIGQAMHFIGAVCVIRQVPVAPLHFAERADREVRGVFESDSLEATHVLPHYDVLKISAREHSYSKGEAQRRRARS